MTKKKAVLCLVLSLVMVFSIVLPVLAIQSTNDGVADLYPPCPISCTKFWLQPTGSTTLPATVTQNEGIERIYAMMCLRCPRQTGIVWYTMQADRYAPIGWSPSSVRECHEASAYLPTRCPELSEIYGKNVYLSSEKNRQVRETRSEPVIAYTFVVTTLFNERSPSVQVFDANGVELCLFDDSLPADLREMVLYYLSIDNEPVFSPFSFCHNSCRNTFVGNTTRTPIAATDSHCPATAVREYLFCRDCGRPAGVRGSVEGWRQHSWVWSPNGGRVCSNCFWIQ